MTVAYLDHQGHVRTVCVCPCMACCAWEGLGALSENRKLVGEEAGSIAGISGEHELKSVHDSQKHRWLFVNVGPQTAHLSHSRVFSRGPSSTQAGTELLSGTSDLFSHKACGAHHLSPLPTGCSL